MQCCNLSCLLTFDKCPFEMERRPSNVNNKTSAIFTVYIYIYMCVCVCIYVATYLVLWYISDIIDRNMISHLFYHLRVLLFIYFVINVSCLTLKVSDFYLRSGDDSFIIYLCFLEKIEFLYELKREILNASMSLLYTRKCNFNTRFEFYMYSDAVSRFKSSITQ